MPEQDACGLIAPESYRTVILVWRVYVLDLDVDAAVVVDLARERAPVRRAHRVVEGQSVALRLTLQLRANLIGRHGSLLPLRAPSVLSDGSRQIQTEI